MICKEKQNEEQSVLLFPNINVSGNIFFLID